MEERIIKITSKRQVTIPKEFFDIIGFQTHIKASIKNGKLIMEPVANNNPLDFSSEILKELLDLGYTGDELHEKFKERMDEMKKATSYILSEAFEDAQQVNEPKGREFIKSLLNEEV